MAAPPPRAAPPPGIARVATLTAALIVAVLGTSVANEALVHAFRLREPALLALLGPVGSAIGGAVGGGWRLHAAPLRSHVLCGVLVFLAFTAGARAQMHLPYAVFVVAKAGRLLPTMAVGALWLRKRYAGRDVAAAALAVAGLVVALLRGHGASRHDGAAHDGAGGVSAGAGWMLCCLCCDGLYANAQEAIMLLRGATTMEVAAQSMGVASALLLASAAASGGGAIAAAARRAAAEPALAATLAAYTLGSALASHVALLAIRDVGAARTGFLLAVVKAVNVAASMAASPSSATWRQAGGAALVFAAVLVSATGRAAPAAGAAAAAVGVAAAVRPRGAAAASPSPTPESGGGGGVADDADSGGGGEGAAAAAAGGSAAAAARRRRVPAGAPLARAATMSALPVPVTLRGPPPPLLWGATRCPPCGAPLPPRAADTAEGVALGRDATGSGYAGGAADSSDAPGGGGGGGGGGATPPPHPAARGPPPHTLSAARLTSGVAHAGRLLATASNRTLTRLSSLSGIERPEEMHDSLRLVGARPLVVVLSPGSDADVDVTDG